VGQGTTTKKYVEQCCWTNNIYGTCQGLSTSCSATKCTLDAECDDGNSATIDKCGSDGKCTHNTAQKCEDKCMIKSPLGGQMSDPFCLGSCYITNLINGVITWTIELIKFVLVCVLMVVIFFIAGGEISKDVKQKDKWLAYIAGLIMSLIIGYGIWMFI
jgi:hypothetical protein